MARKALIVLLVLAAAGLVRWPLEEAATREFKRRHLLPPDLSLGLREKLGQNSYAAALGGARSLVASIQSLMIVTAWEVQDWGQVENRARLVTSLQPRMPSYWETGAWHLAYNASGWYRYEWTPQGSGRGRPDPEPVALLRREMWERYIRKGQEFLDDGIRNNPENFHLLEQAGMLAADPLKLPDRARAADYYGRAAALPQAPLRTRRFEAYELSYLPGRREEAWRKLTGLYQENPAHHVPTLLSTLLDLQMERGIPPADRVPEAALGRDPVTVYAKLRDYTAYRRNRGGDISNALLARLREMEETLGIPLGERLEETPEKSGP